MKKAALLISVTTFIALLLIGCGAKPKDAIIGSWLKTGYDCAKTGKDCVKVYDANKTLVYNFKKGNEYGATITGIDDTGKSIDNSIKYIVHSNKLYILVDNTLEVFEISSIDNDSMVLQVETIDDKSKLGKFITFNKKK